MGVIAQPFDGHILENFQVKGEADSRILFGSGHIHDTYLITLKSGSKLILQRVNHEVFTETILVCENIKKVSDHIWNQMIANQESEIDRKCMRVIPAIDGKAFYKDNLGRFWRLFTFIDDSESIDEVDRLDQAYEAAKAIGQFQTYLSDLDAGSIGESIPNFHHIGWRYENLEKAIEENKAGRVREVKAEISFARKRKKIKRDMLDLLVKKSLPIRVVHNDTKINNVLFDKTTGKAICVIDLDTVMPGSVIYDFGDMIRTFTSPAPEDEADLHKVFVRIDVFEALVKGYLEGAASFLTNEEKENLILGAKVITLIMGIRFLTDYLNGDTYYKIHYPTQNLDRCRNQFHLLQDILAKEVAMREILEKNRLGAH